MSTTNGPAGAAASTSARQKPRSGITCRGCDTRLPVRLAAQGEEAALWVCASCGAQFAGILIGDAEKERLPRVQLADVHFDTTELPPINPIIRQLVERLATTPEAYLGSDRRDSARVPRQLEVVFIRLDAEFMPKGAPLRAMVHNLSEGGLAMIADEPIHESNVAIRIGDGDSGSVQMFSRVVRLQHLTAELYDIGVQFAFRLGGKVKT